MKYRSLLNIVISLIALSSLVIGCGAEEDDILPAASPLVISGSLGGVAASSFGNGSQKLEAMSSVGSLTISASELELYGLAFSDPPEAVAVPLLADGSFSLIFSANANGAPISLIFRYKTGTTNAGTEVGVVKFQDASKLDMNGDASKSSSIALTGTVSLGALIISDDGDVVVDVATIAASVEDTSATGTPFDFTGVWQFTAFDGALPTGYTAPCAAGDMNCDGPPIGMSVYIKRIAGKSYTPDTTCQNLADADNFDGTAQTCAGTAETDDRFGIMVWQSLTAFASCGSNLGFDYETAKAYAHVDFSASDVAEGAFTYSSGWVDGWKNVASATANREYDNCQSVSVAVNGVNQPGYKCVDANSEYQINLEGGCVNTATNLPVHITNWNGVNVPDSCSNNTIVGLPTGYDSNTCVYSNIDHDGDSGSATANIGVSCTWTGGAFNADDTPDTDNTFDWSNLQSIISDSASCSSGPGITNADQLAELQCYADYYYQNANREDESLCLRRVETDWSATTPADFLVADNGPERAATLFVLSLFNYDDPNSGFFEDIEKYSRGVNSGNSWVNCKVEETFRMSFKRRSDSVLVAEFVSSVRLIDIDKAVCKADSDQGQNGNLRTGTTKQIMLLSKLP